MLPTRHPFASSRFRFASRIVVLPQPSRTDLQYRPWSLRSLLREHLDDDDRILVGSVHDSPGHIRINHPELVTPLADRRHRTRMRHPEGLAPLKASQQEPGLESSQPRERWCLHLTVQPGERLVARAHSAECMSVSTCPQADPHGTLGRVRAPQRRRRRGGGLAPSYRPRAGSPAGVEPTCSFAYSGQLGQPFRSTRAPVPAHLGAIGGKRRCALWRYGAPKALQARRSRRHASASRPARTYTRRHVRCRYDPEMSLWPPDVAMSDPRVAMSRSPVAMAVPRVDVARPAAVVARLPRSGAVPHDPTTSRGRDVLHEHPRRGPQTSVTCSTRGRDVVHQRSRRRPPVGSRGKTERVNDFETAATRYL